MTEIEQKTAERVSRMIRGLQAKTVENGCTEEEAIAAAMKVRELMDEYRLTMSDVEIQAETVEVEDISTDRKGMKPVDYCLHGIARYCGVKIWRVSQKGRNQTVRILGLKSDSEMAAWLYSMIDTSIWWAANGWQKDPETGWKAMDGTTKKRACMSFMVGMATRVGQRLNDLAAALEPVAKTATGTGLVVVKNALVDDAFAKLNIRFSGHSSISVKDRTGYAAGVAAGNKVTFDRPVGSANTKRIGA